MDANEGMEGKGEINLDGEEGVGAFEESDNF